MKELYKAMRPANLSQVVGQDAAISQLKDMGKKGEIPHFLLLSGPSGCGKTTIARILKQRLKIANVDFKEINASDFRGIDTVRSIRETQSTFGITGGSRMWLIDEAHKLTTDAQNAALKLLEDTPEHVYFVFCTTDPQKLIKTIRNRATHLQLQSVNPSDLRILIERAALDLDDEVTDRLIQAAEGSPRRLLVLADQVRRLSKAKAIELLKGEDEPNHEAIQLARALMEKKPNWKKISGLLKGIKEEPEQLRWMVLGYANSVLLGGGPLAGRAYLLIRAFEANFFDSKKAGLTAACYELFTDN